MRLVFLVSRPPYEFEGGDSRLTRVVLEAAAVTHDVAVVSYGHSSRMGGAAAEAGPLRIRQTLVERPPRELAAICRRAALHGVSLTHERFVSEGLITAVSNIGSMNGPDRLVAEHAYMAEAIRRYRPAWLPTTAVNLHVREAPVMRARQGPLSPLYRLEARRIERDERRLFGAVRSVATFSSIEAEQLTIEGACANPHVLQMVLPPAPRPRVGQHALFLGDREWYPNDEAFARALRLWPRVLELVGEAQLLVVGRPGKVGAAGARNVQDLGFVDDLQAVWARAAVLIAPVATGGGVRVKVLEAVARGVPVVGTTAALGSLPEYLPLRPYDEDGLFVTAVAEALRAPAVSDAYEASREYWSSGALPDAINAWLED